MSSIVVAWFVIVGLLLATMGTVGPMLRRWWLSSSIIYLVTGYLIGPGVANLLSIDLVNDAKLIEHLTEIAVIVSLFAAGMKIRSPLGHRHWIAPVVLASITMSITVCLAAALGHFALGLPLAFAILLAAVLAPTDPVLAAEVQMEDPDDQDGLRRTLTAEAGFNDGTAFPLVLLAVALLNPDVHSLGPSATRWIFVDVIYKVSAGLIFGGVAGWYLTKCMLWIRQRVRADIAADEMMTFGFISLVYGLALWIDSYAFLAVFAAALAMRQVELANNKKSAAAAIQEAEAVDEEHEADAPEHAATMMTKDSLIVADTMERLVEIVLVVMVGALLSQHRWLPWSAWTFGAVMVLVLRPISVWMTIWPLAMDRPQRLLVAWFGIRGIGTFYYLTHAIVLCNGDFHQATMQTVINASLATVTISILLHGTSVTPLMKWYQSTRETTANENASTAPPLNNTASQ